MGVVTLLWHSTAFCVLPQGHLSTVSPAHYVEATRLLNAFRQAAKQILSKEKGWIAQHTRSGYKAGESRPARHP